MGRKFEMRPAVAGHAHAWNSDWPYFVPRWRGFLLRQGFGEHVEGFSLRSKIKQGLEGLGKGFRLRR